MNGTLYIIQVSSPITLTIAVRVYVLKCLLCIAMINNDKVRANKERTVAVLSPVKKITVIVNKKNCAS